VTGLTMQNPGPSNGGAVSGAGTFDPATSYGSVPSAVSMLDPGPSDGRGISGITANDPGSASWLTDGTLPGGTSFIADQAINSGNAGGPALTADNLQSALHLAGYK
jgi:hypothetical protein